MELSEISFPLCGQETGFSLLSRLFHPLPPPACLPPAFFGLLLPLPFRVACPLPPLPSPTSLLFSNNSRLRRESSLTPHSAGRGTLHPFKVSPVRGFAAEETVVCAAAPGLRLSPRLLPGCYLLGMRGPWSVLVCPNLLQAGSSSPRATLSFATSVAISRAWESSASVGFSGVSRVPPCLAPRAGTSFVAVRLLSPRRGRLVPPGAQPGSEQVPPQVSASPGPFAPVRSGKFCGGTTPGEGSLPAKFVRRKLRAPLEASQMGRLGVPAATDGRAASGPCHGRRLGIQAEAGGCGKPDSLEGLVSHALWPPLRRSVGPFLGLEPRALCASWRCAPAQERMVGGSIRIALRWRLPPCSGD